MADKKISDLPALVGTAPLTALVEIEDAGTSKKSTIQQVLDNILAGVSSAFDTLAEIATALGTKLTAANNLSDLADFIAARANLGVSYGETRGRFYEKTDCNCIGPTVTGGYYGGGMIASFGGTGATVSPVSSPAAPSVGVVSLDMGTTTTGRSALGLVASVANTAFRFGQGRTRFLSRFAIPVLSNGTDTFTTRLGFVQYTTTESSNAAYFRYTDGVNSGKWQAVTRSGGVETAVDTGVTVVAGTFQRFEIDVNAAGTSVAFYIDGVQAPASPITTNIPTGSNVTGYGVYAQKSAGTTATSGGHVDAIEVEQLLTSAR